MTALVTASSSPSQSSQTKESTPHSAWRRLHRVAWLQHRSGCLAFVAVAVVVVIAILVEKSRVSGSYASFVAAGCAVHPLAQSTACNTDALALGGTVDFRTIGTGLSVFPLLVGVFLGAPLISRELESGTFRFAWTQGTSRSRLVLTTLTLLALSVGAMALVLGLLFGGSYAHVYEVMVAPDVSQWQATLYATTWWMLALWMLLGLAIGALLGTVIRRTVAAMGATAAIVGGLIAGAYLLLPKALHIGAQVRRIAAPVGTMGFGSINSPTQSGWHFPQGSWVVGSWLTGSRGHVLTVQATQQVAYELSSRTSAGQQRWLSVHHDAFWVSYQPPGHFWMVQGAEGLVLLVLAGLCAFVTVRRLRGRVGA